MKDKTPAIGIIGGSGLYRIEQLRDATEQKIETPFGSPSDALIGGNVSGRQVTFCRDMAAVTEFSRTS